jgi:POT family proton-dependent oligopeptide transporter
MSAQTAPVVENLDVPAQPAEQVQKGHPAGLYILFATEMWERFSYYGMRALLVLYLVAYLKWRPSEASATYKWYTSLVYLTPLLGGFLADRVLGLRLAITIGGVLMAIGHFLMAFEPLPFLYCALGFLILGNGFFKPNISTMVGKMYAPTDPRRDGAFTIFYMGINLGAFFSPLVCGWLHEHYGFHYGFAAAGVGMVIGLVVFLLGQRRVAADIAAVGGLAGGGSAPASESAHEDASERVSRIGGIAGMIGTVVSPFMIAIAVLVPAYYFWMFHLGQVKVIGMVMPIAFSGVSLWMGLTLRSIRGAGYDKSTVIFLLFAFSVLFWMAFEQAGNALNLWAEYNTNRHVPTAFLRDKMGPTYPSEWFQSVNPFLIFTLAPLFAMVWLALEKRGKGISTVAKMLWGLVFMALSFAAMVGGAMSESRTTSHATLEALPSQIQVQDHKLVMAQRSEDPADASKPPEYKTLDAGQLGFDPATHQLSVAGVFPPFAREEALQPTIDPALRKSIKKAEEASGDATATNQLKLQIAPLPAGFTFPLPVMSLAEVEREAKADAKDESDAAQKRAARRAMSVVGWDQANGTITFAKKLTADQRLSLIESAAPGEWRASLSSLEEASKAARVSGFWLFLSYFLATLGELCVSPVGLSMVTKLSPARFGSLFMGVWLLTSSVAQYLGGALGELWGEVTPTSYFTIFVWTSIIGSVVLGLLIIPIRRLMHDVK